MSDQPSDPNAERPVVREGQIPRLSAAEWIVFAVLAGVLAATNIYTTLLIGWGDTGSIIAVLASVVMLGVISKHKPAIHTINLGQTMVSAGGSVGFAVASYAAVRIIDPSFDPPVPQLICLFAAMGMLGAMVGASVRESMVKYFWPSGTACAVIQKSVTAELAPGEKSRPIWMLKVWGSVAAVLTLLAKIKLDTADDAHAILHAWKWKLQAGMPSEKELGLGADPLYYGIGVVVGPRVGLGMLLGSLAVPFLIQDNLVGTAFEPKLGDWVKWIAIAVLTLPTFAAIVFAYLYKTPAIVPPGFTPGRTEYRAPASRNPVYIVLGLVSAVVIGWLAKDVFNLPFAATAVTIAVAWPLCMVNGRVTGDTDINPIRLVAIVLLSGFFWLITKESRTAISMLGMAVVAGTLASVAVDMMQDYRTGHLVDANPVQQTTVQFVGSIIGAIVAIPVLNMLIAGLGGRIGEGMPLKAPGATIWAKMAEAMSAEDFTMAPELKYWVIGVSLLGCGYAFLTVWPKSARFMPSLFGIGIGMLVGVETSSAIFVGGLMKSAVTLVYTSGKTGPARDDGLEAAGNDTMLAGSSVFAAAAVVSILLIIVLRLFAAAGIDPGFYLATE
ncbi:MAG: OPT/YSL family transporter [Planctomycetes bacterium]|nr:OPT/YSL family transporter [Planctomycetota bacterium]